MNIWLAEIWQAWRASLRRPGFLILALCVLGLGTGASAAVFTLVDNVVLRPLPFVQPDRLAVIGMQMPGFAPIASTRQYQHLRKLDGVVSEGYIDVSSTPENISIHGVPQRASVLHADHNLLPTLGVRPAIGRNFTAREDMPHGVPVAMLGHGFWERAWGGDPHVIGKQVRVKGVAYTIVGVLPASFDAFCARMLGGSDIVLPAAISAEGSDATIGGLIVARLAPGIATDAVKAQVPARLHRLYAGTGDAYMLKQPFVVSGLAKALHAQSESTLVLFAASALCVLLIALVNLANLMALRTLARRHDGVIRAALGASSARRYLPAFAESLLVGVLGGLLGVGLATLGLGVLRHFVPVAWLGDGGLDVGVATWWFALLAAVVCALLATSLGVWRGHRIVLGDELHEGGRSGTNRQVGRLSRVLVVVQLALATVLLVGAGLFLHALMAASEVPLGFNPHGVLTAQLVPLRTRYADANAVLTLGKQLQRRLAAQPGVVHADVSNALPSGGNLFVMSLHVGDGPRFGANYAGVDARYFATFGIPVLKGRVFTRMDQRGGEPVAVVNEAFARAHFGGHALGKTIRLAQPEPVSMRIVGVVGNTRMEGPLQPVSPILYVPWQQMPAAYLEGGKLSLAVRVRGNPDAYRKTIRSVLADVAPMQPVARMDTSTSRAAVALAHVRLILLLVGLFAALALLLAMAGIYAVMAVVVAAREHEFGVRLALGASPQLLMRLVLRGALIQIGIGLVLGIGVAVLLSHALSSLLAQIHRSAADPWAIAGVCVLLAVVGVLACLLPALRAGRVAPMHALRGE
ncbi:MAG TPA: ADOP family duplicated permease [Rhodanobacteraceae bacterium]